MNTYINLHGRSLWASINTYYCVLKETDFKPDIIWICTESIYEDQLPVLDEAFKIISVGYDFTPKIRTLILQEGSIIESGLEVGGLVDSLKKTQKVALDITSARKALVAGALLATASNKPDHIFYLMIDTLDNISKPYPMISKQHHKLHDFRAETRRP